MSQAAALNKKYRAFISYRHADNKAEGRQWATWLHHALETFEIPEDLIGTKNQHGQIIPQSIYPIFRDEDELPADADLGGAITRALDATHLLVVLCSPQAVKSKYVAEEIDYFKRNGGAGRVIAAILDGEPNASWDEGKHKLGFSPEEECFPEPLRIEYAPDGNRTEKLAEPIAADFRVVVDGKPVQGWTSREAYQQHLREHTQLSAREIKDRLESYEAQKKTALLKIVAGILGLPLSTLTQRDKQYQLDMQRKRAKQLRSWLSAVSGLAVVAVVAGVVAYMNQLKADQKTLETQQALLQVEQEKQAALYSQSKYLLQSAQAKGKAGRFDTAMLLALNGLPGTYGGQRQELPELRGFYSEARNQNRVLTAQTFSADGPWTSCLSDGSACVTSDTLGEALKQKQQRCRIDQETNPALYQIARQVLGEKFWVSQPFLCALPNPSGPELLFYLDFHQFDRLSAMLDADERPSDADFLMLWVWNRQANVLKSSVRLPVPAADMAFGRGGSVLLAGADRGVYWLDIEGQRGIAGVSLVDLLQSYYARAWVNSEAGPVLVGYNSLGEESLRVLHLDDEPKRYPVSADRDVFFTKLIQQSSQSRLILQGISFEEDALRVYDASSGVQQVVLTSGDTSGFQDTSLSDSLRPQIDSANRYLLTQPDYNRVQLTTLADLAYQCSVTTEQEIVSTQFNEEGSAFVLTMNDGFAVYDTAKCEQLLKYALPSSINNLLFANWGKKADEYVLHAHQNQGDIAVFLVSTSTGQIKTLHAAKIFDVTAPANDYSSQAMSVLSRSSWVEDKLLMYSHVNRHFKLVDPNTQHTLVNSFSSHPDVLSHFVMPEQRRLWVIETEGLSAYSTVDGSLQFTLPMQVVSAQADASRLVVLTRQAELLEVGEGGEPKPLGKLPSNAYQLVQLEGDSLLTFASDAIEVWNVPLLKRQPSGDDLPPGRKCLSDDERERFYLPARDTVQTQPTLSANGLLATQCQPSVTPQTPPA